MKGESTLFPWAPLSLALCDNPVFMPERLDGHHDGSATCSSLLLSITTQSLCSTYPVNTTVSNIFFFLFSPQKPFYTPYVLFDWEAKGCLGSWEQKGKKREADCRLFSSLCRLTFQMQNLSKCYYFSCH